MFLYLLQQDINDDYDTYDACLVCAESEEEARKIHPGYSVKYYRDGNWYDYDDKIVEDYYVNTWVPASEIDKINVTKIGILTNDDYKNGGVVIDSFNAG
jgi:hypothetical protein